MDKIYQVAFDSIITKKDYTIDEKIEVLKICLESGIDINRKKSHVLMSAIAYDNLRIINFLIENGIDIRADNDFALFWVYEQIIKSRNTKGSIARTLDIMELLLSLGVDPNARNNKLIIIMCNSKTIHIDIIKLLVKYGMDAFAHSNKLFEKACKDKNLESVKYLISIGADCTGLNNMAISYAFDKNENYELKKILLDSGANPNTTNKLEICFPDGKYRNNSYNLLEISVLYGYDVESCKMLLEYGADINLCHNLINKFKIDMRCTFNIGDHAEKKAKECINLFLEYGLDIAWIFKSWDISGKID